MNKILRYSDVAKSLEVNTAIISMAVKRNKLLPTIEDDKKLIDIENPVNKLWVDIYCEKNNKTFDINRVFNSKKPEKKEEKISKEIEQEDNIIIKKSTNNYGIALEKTKLEIKRLKNQDKLDRLKIQKMQGLLIPTDAAKDVFIFSETTIVTTFKQHLKGLLDIIQNRSNMNHAQYIELNKELDQEIDIIHAVAKENILSGLDGVVKEYQEVRGRGESK
jgi:hypothetical protein